MKLRFGLIVFVAVFGVTLAIATWRQGLSQRNAVQPLDTQSPPMPILASPPKVNSASSSVEFGALKKIPVAPSVPAPSDDNTENTSDSASPRLSERERSEQSREAARSGRTR
jgi:hypothetical protein